MDPPNQKKKKTALLVGHGRLYQTMRCCPIPLAEFCELVRGAEVTMVDSDVGVLPDVVADVRAEGWARALPEGEYDVVIEVVSHLASDVRGSMHY
jgi:hypothetical protein